MIDIGPILRSMRSNFVGVLFIVLQIAITSAVVLNAVAAVQFVRSLITIETGIVEEDLFHLSITWIDDYNVEAGLREDLEFIRNTPGIVNAVQSNAIPMSNSGWSTTLKTSDDPDLEGINAAHYMVDEHGVETLGLNIIAGRNFQADEVVWWSTDNEASAHTLIITKDVGEQLFPELPVNDYLGQEIFHDGSRSGRVVGVVENLSKPWVNPPFNWSFLAARQNDFSAYFVLIRTEPGRRDELMSRIESTFAERNRSRIVRNLRSLSQTARDAQSGNLAVGWILGTTAVLLVITASCGIVGVTSFNVRKRTQQIGMRRAVGATRWDVMRYFLVEVLLVVSIGLVFGLVLAVFINMLLVEAAEFPKFEYWWVAAGALGFYVLGLMAVIGPAYQATTISPVIASEGGSLSARSKKAYRVAFAN